MTLNGHSASTRKDDEDLTTECVNNLALMFGLGAVFMGGGITLSSAVVVLPPDGAEEESFSVLVDGMIGGGAKLWKFFCTLLGRVLYADFTKSKKGRTWSANIGL